MLVLVLVQSVVPATPGGSGWGGSNAAMKQTSPLHCSGFPPRLEGVCGWEQSCYNSKLSRQHSCGFPPTRALRQANLFCFELGLPHSPGPLGLVLSYLVY